MDEITLPRSGVQLERSAEKGTHWRRYIGPFCVEVRDGGLDRPAPATYPRWSYSTGGGWSFCDTREQVIESLDKSMLYTLASLLPADARERIAKALMDEDGCDDGDRAELRATYKARADAVLRALGGGA